MTQTARFVRESGGHSELVLRVRQAQNPNFAFLRPDDRLHAYFRWLVQAAPQVGFTHAPMCIQVHTAGAFLADADSNPLYLIGASTVPLRSSDCTWTVVEGVPQGLFQSS